MVHLHVAQRTVVARCEDELRVGRLGRLHHAVEFVAVSGQPFLGVERRGVGLHLELDVEALFAFEEFEQFVEEEHLVALLGAQSADFGLGLLLDGSRAVGRAFERTVVGDDQRAVAGHADVGLEAAVAGVVAGLKGRKGVFIMFHASAAVREETDLLLLSRGVERRGHAGGQCDHSDLVHFDRRVWFVIFGCRRVSNGRRPFVFAPTPSRWRGRGGASVRSA